MRVIIECKGRRQEYTLKEGPNVIGRGAGCELRFHDPSLSRKHLQVEMHGGEIAVRDLNTHNGTFLGPQRIREAKLKSGVRLRAGNVWIRFESATTPAQRAAEAAATGREHPELAADVPDSPTFLEADEEATPVDANVVHAVAADKGAQAFARDGRWFMKDPSSGEEIEIVPSGAALAPAPEAPGQREAAHKVRKKLVLVTAASLVAVLALMLVIGKLVSKPQGPVQYLSDSVVKSVLDEAAKACYAGKRADAIKAVKELQAQAVSPRWRAPLKALGEALEADAVTDAPVADWLEKALVAEKRWTVLLNGEMAKTFPSVGELVKKRLERVLAEVSNNARLVEARRSLEKNDYANALLYASNVDADSIFRKDAEPIIPAVLDSMTKNVTSEADRGNWAEAITRAQNLLKMRPELAEKLDPLISAWTRNEEDRKTIEQARKLAAESRFSDVIEKVSTIEARSPYAKDAAALKADAERKGGMQLAVAAYNAKEGEKALRLLAQGGDTESQLVQKIQSVMKLREEGMQAIKDRKFDEAKEKFQKITQVETSDANQYAKEAAGFVGNMDALVREQARILVQEADAAVVAREYRKARQKYEDALRLDASLGNARDGLRRLSQGAMKDYNWAINVEGKDPEAALQLYQDVRDRLLPVDKLYIDAEVAIARLKTRLNKPEPPAKP